MAVVRLKCLNKMQSLKPISAGLFLEINACGKDNLVQPQQSLFFPISVIILHIKNTLSVATVERN